MGRKNKGFGPFPNEEEEEMHEYYCPKCESNVAWESLELVETEPTEFEEFHVLCNTRVEHTLKLGV
jgi:hypothetical protein